MLYRVVAPNIDTARWVSFIGLDPKKVAADGLFIIRGVRKNWLGESLTKRRVTPVCSAFLTMSPA